jgi:hypothetical protein
MQLRVEDPPRDTAPALRPDASVQKRSPQAVVADDQQVCKVRLLLLGKGVVSVHRIERPLAARSDEDQQSWRGAQDPGDARLR